MTDFAVLIGLYVAIVAVVELTIKRKLQAALAPVLAWNVFGYAIAILATTFGIGTVFVFWTGMFMVWFGVRSHLESSILLRMLRFLDDGAATAADLVGRYEEHYGRAARVDELARAGLIVRTSSGFAATRKGHRIARIASLLR